MADDMCKQNGLLLRGKTYYFQARIPQEIRKEFSADFPKPVHREPLTAATLMEAKAQVRQKWAALEARFRALREPPKTTLPEAEARRILAAALIPGFLRMSRGALVEWTSGISPRARPHWPNATSGNERRLREVS
jgi:hypothetical protein